MRTMEDLLARLKKRIDQLHKDSKPFCNHITYCWTCVRFAKSKQRGEMPKVPFFSQDYYHSVN